MGKNVLSAQELETLRFIRNQLVHKGVSPSIRDIQAFFGYKSSRSALVLVQTLIEEGYLKRERESGRLKLIGRPESDKLHAKTVDIPLVGNVACGEPLLAEENIEMMVPVSTTLAKPPHNYFLLRAHGDSMNAKGIGDGDLVLVKQQPDADNGQAVVALINDEATVKELYKTPDAIILKPNSTNPRNKPIILHEDFLVQGVVVATIPEM